MFEYLFIYCHLNSYATKTPQTYNKCFCKAAKINHQWGRVLGSSGGKGFELLGIVPGPACDASLDGFGSLSCNTGCLIVFALLQ